MMFDKSQIVPILNNLKIVNGNLICRFDCDLFSVNKDDNKILVLKLNGLSNAENAFRELSHGVEKVVEYIVYEGVNKTKEICFSIDYKSDISEFSFLELSENYENFTHNDFSQKIKILTKWYLEYFNNFNQLHDKHENLISGINKFFSKEYDVLNRKLKFFLDHESSKAENIESQLKILDEISKLIKSN
jgi:hypothetical protein